MTRTLAAVALAPVTVWAAWQAAGAFAGDVWVGTRIVTMVPIIVIPFIVVTLWVGTRGAYSGPRVRPVASRSHLTVVPALPAAPVTVHATVTDLPPVRQEIGAR